MSNSIRYTGRWAKRQDAAITTTTGAMIEDYNKCENDNVYFINTKGWIPKSPVHPLRDGHRIIAENLTKKLLEIL